MLCGLVTRRVCSMARRSLSLLQLPGARLSEVKLIEQGKLIYIVIFVSPSRSTLSLSAVLK